MRQSNHVSKSKLAALHRNFGHAYIPFTNHHARWPVQFCVKTTFASIRSPLPKILLRPPSCNYEVIKLAFYSTLRVRFLWSTIYFVTCIFFFFSNNNRWTHLFWDIIPSYTPSTFRLGINLILVKSTPHFMMDGKQIGTVFRKDEFTKYFSFSPLSKGVNTKKSKFSNDSIE